MGQSGTIKSPGFPGTNYPDNSFCEWYLDGPTGHYLTLTYDALNLQSTAGCTADYVEIREYNATGGNRLLCITILPFSINIYCSWTMLIGSAAELNDQHLKELCFSHSILLLSQSIKATRD